MLMNPDRGDPKLTFKGEVIELPENPGMCLSEIFKANWVLVFENTASILL